MPHLMDERYLMLCLTRHVRLVQNEETYKTRKVLHCKDC